MHETRRIGGLAIGIALAALALSTPPASTFGQPAGSAAAPERLTIPYTQFVLPNGLRVVLHEDHRVPVVSVNVWYHVGSGRERPGRTGFAHLFEHLMFEGSGHVKEGDFDNLLEGAGGDNNGSTNTDRTNYYITGPSSALDLALFLESDRMGYLLDAMSPEKVNGQRDVVKNERRQGVENAPYGKVSDELPALLYPKGHPYSWDTIGSMADLSAASYEDVVEFFKTFYVPANASLVIAGDIDPIRTRGVVEKWFSDVKTAHEPPPVDPPAASLTGVVKKTITDKVQLARLHLAWLTPPRFTPGDAELDIAASILAGGKNSRLYKRLVYDLQVAQDVTAMQQSGSLGSSFLVIVTARTLDGVSPTEAVSRIRTIVDEELARLRAEPPSARELQRAVNQYEAGFYDVLENLTSKADRINTYATFAGNPDYAHEDLSRYRSLDPRDVQAAVLEYLPSGRRVELTVEPEAGGKQ